jgi:4-hydroxybenzoate polyprenyltransferase
MAELLLEFVGILIHCLLQGMFALLYTARSPHLRRIQCIGGLCLLAMLGSIALFAAALYFDLPNGFLGVACLLFVVTTVLAGSIGLYVESQHLDESRGK